MLCELCAERNETFQHRCLTTAEACVFGSTARVIFWLANRAGAHVLSFHLGLVRQNKLMANEKNAPRHYEKRFACSIKSFTMLIHSVSSGSRQTGLPARLYQ
jgi:predicted GNAT family acetyltransferase